MIHVATWQFVLSLMVCYFVVEPSKVVILMVISLLELATANMLHMTLSLFFLQTFDLSYKNLMISEFFLYLVKNTKMV